MPTFVKIAAQQQNISRVTSKGYFIKRKGKVVECKWGAIKAVKRNFYWAGKNLPQSRTTEFKTLEEALRYYNDKLSRRKKEGYSEQHNKVLIQKFKWVG